MTRHRHLCPLCPLCLVLAALGALAMLAGTLADIDAPVFRLGLTVFLIGGLGLIAIRSGATAAAIEAARQAAYDSGYADASEAAVPVGNVRHLALSRPAQQLGEELHVGS